MSELLDNVAKIAVTDPAMSKLVKRITANFDDFKEVIPSTEAVLNYIEHFLENLTVLQAREGFFSCFCYPWCICCINYVFVSYLRSRKYFICSFICLFLFIDRFMYYFSIH